MYLLWTMNLNASFDFEQTLGEGSRLSLATGSGGVVFCGVSAKYTSKYTR